MNRERIGYEYKDYGDTKKCSKCENDLPIGDFALKHDVKRGKGYRASSCKKCMRESQRLRYESHRKSNPFLHKATRIKSRASSLGVPYDLDKDYLESIWTGSCPIFGQEISLSEARGNPWCAELDRLRPDLGYVKGNVRFLSRKANSYKSNMTLEEAEKIYLWMEKEYAREPNSSEDQS
jgi:hypothetical protein